MGEIFSFGVGVLLRVCVVMCVVMCVCVCVCVCSLGGGAVRSGRDVFVWRMTTTARR